MKTQINEFLKAHKKVRSGKRRLSDKDFIKFRSQKLENLNSLGKFFSDKKASLDELNTIAYEFNRKEYALRKYVCIILPKGKDDYRPILAPHPRDRIMFSFILEYLKTKLLPLINTFNIFGSGKRTDYPNIKKIIESIYLESKKHKFILKIDISKFFPSIRKDVLSGKLDNLIDDKYILKLVRDSFNNEIDIKYPRNCSPDKKTRISEDVRRGIPQGCAYSPLIANFYGIEMDEFIKNEGLVSFRYIDDMLIFTESKEQAEIIFEKLKALAQEKLGLKIHEIDNKKKNKTYIQPANHTFEYLGIEINSNGTFKIPVDKIRKEINLIKLGIFNKQTIKRFSSKDVIRVLKSQIKGWKTFYEKNFPSAYQELQNKPCYNLSLKRYYESILYSNSKLKKDLNKVGFNISNKDVYLY